MAQEHTVSFKVFLQNDGLNEVRRFGIDRDVVTSFSYLREKLQTVFPSLHGRDFTVAWKGNQSCNYFYYMRATVLVKWYMYTETIWRSFYLRFEDWVYVYSRIAYFSSFPWFYGVSGGAVGLGTTPQDRRFWVRFLVGSLEISKWHIQSAFSTRAYSACDRMRTKEFPWGAA